MKPTLGYLCGAPRLSTRPEANACGPRAHMVGVMNGFETLGWEVSRFIVGDDIPLEWSVKAPEQKINQSPTRLIAADLARIALGVVNRRRAWNRIGRVDWIYERLASFQALGAPFQRRGIPWILETNAPLSAEAKSARKSIKLESVARKLEMRAYRECSAIVCISEELKEIIQSAAGVPARKIIVIPNGVDTDFFHPRKHRAKRLFPQFTVGFVGGLYDWQGLDSLINVVAELRREGHDICISVVGDGLMRKSWEAHASDLGLLENIRFVGQVPWTEVPSYIAGFDVAFCGQVRLQLGTMYGSPLKLYEYSAMSKPVIASAFPDAKQVIRDRSNGFLFAPGDISELKQAVRDAYLMKAQLADMGFRARATVISDHSWTARVSKTIDGVRQVLEFHKWKVLSAAIECSTTAS